MAMTNKLKNPTQQNSKKQENKQINNNKKKATGKHPLFTRLHLSFSHFEQIFHFPTGIR